MSVPAPAHASALCHVSDVQCRYTMQSQYLYAYNHNKWLSPDRAAVGGGLSTSSPNTTVASLPQSSFDFESPLEGFAVMLLGVIGARGGRGVAAADDDDDDAVACR